jgi:hypothetical protein
MNSHLVNNVYDIPKEILEYISTAFTNLNGNYVDGCVRAETLLNDKKVTYGQLKKIIHEMKHQIKYDSTQYHLCGGDLMMEWSTNFLNGERNLVKNKKDSKVRADQIGSNIRNVKDLNVDTKKNTYVSPILIKSDSLSLSEQINKIKKIIKCQRN